MSEWDTAGLAAADRQFLWHPFTSMREWCAPDHEPLILVEGHGAILRDSRGREYIDGNSSIWTNIHGHNHPAINAAIREQLERVAHTSFLGFTNPPAIELAREIVALFPKDTLTRVFYSDDGSTGVEVALRIVEQYWQLKGSKRHRIIAFEEGYHGDTAGAASLGARALFRDGPTAWNFPATRVASLEELDELPTREKEEVAAVIIEPLVRGAAGIKLWPTGLLKGVRDRCDRTGALLIVDEVLTGFGRTGKMFASEHEEAIPDIMVLAKALTGGYVPLAITLLNEKIFQQFKSAPSPADILFYGHSYCGNAIACAAARASLEIFQTDNVLRTLESSISLLQERLSRLQSLPAVSEIRQCGFMAGIELKTPARPDGTSDLTLGARVCLAARRHGLLTRPIKNTVVLMPPYCISNEQLSEAVQAIESAISEVASHPS